MKRTKRQTAPKKRKLAQLSQGREKICTGQMLADELEKTPLPAGEGSAWHKDLVSARKGLTAPKDKWR